MAPGKEPPSKPPEPADIEGQLDDLLAQIAKAEPDLLTQPAPAVHAPAASDSAPAPADVTPTPVDDPLSALAAAEDEPAADDANHNELTPQAIEDQLAAVAQVLGKTPEEVSKTVKATAPVAKKDQDQPEAQQQQAMDDLLAAVTAAVKDLPPTAAPAKPVMPVMPQQSAPAQPAQPAAAKTAAPIADDQPVVAASQVEENAPADSPSEASPASAATDAAGDALGLDLASQIQQLLDDARTQPTPGESFNAEDDAQQDAELDAASSPSAAAVKPDTHDAVAAAEDPATNIDAIDQMLADGADEAVVGDFETINEVLAAEPARDADDETVTSDVVDAAAVSSAAGTAAAAASPSDAVPVAAEEEEEIDGSFETPTEILTASDQQAAASDAARAVDASVLSADAKAVAQELDDQPELKAKQAGGGQAASAGKPAATTGEKSSKLSGLLSKLPAALGAIKAMPAAVQQACLLINRPLLGLSPQTRDLVGYAGLITVFWGSVTIVGKVVFAMMG